MDLKQLTARTSRLAPGHGTCQGCGIPIIVRTVLRAIEDPVIAVVATGCLEVTTTIYPETAWEIPFIHSLFENAAATASGIVAALRYQKGQGGIKKTPQVVVFGGDGGTYDIGFQALSGALERGDDFLYICYDNQAYMNTGVQRSSATPKGARTTTTPASATGQMGLGKAQFRKPLTEIVAAHQIPYVAQASPSYVLDLHNKVRKAISHSGPKFINVFSPCPLGWRMDTALSMKLASLAVQTRFWPLYEVEEGKYKLTANVARPTPLDEFLKPQGRFKHLFTPHGEKAKLELEKEVGRRWRRLKEKLE